MGLDLANWPAMTHPPHVTCSDQLLGQTIADWLRDSLLPLPQDLKWDVGLVDEPVAWNDPREAFAQPGLRIRAGQPGGTVRIETPDPLAWAEVEEHAPAATIRLLPSALEAMDRLLPTFFLVTLIFSLRRRGLHHVHGASVLDHSGRGWLLLGNSNSGKSTTAALLASRGWGIGTDDIAFLGEQCDRVGVTGFRSRIAVRPGGMALLQASGGIHLERRNKTGFWPEELGTRWIQDIVPEIVVFTAVGEGPTRLVPLSQSSGLCRGRSGSCLKPPRPRNTWTCCAGW